MMTSYAEKYQQRDTAAVYDQEICRSDSDAVWAAERRILKRLIRRHVPRDGKAVDFACGTGRISEMVKPMVGSFLGIDISEAMLERARKRVPDTEFRRVDILSNPELVPDDCDLITAFRFLLLAEPSLRTDCIRMLARKLKPDTGVMILNTHGNPNSFRAIASAKNRLLGRNKPLPRFSRADMLGLAADCGLELVAASGCGFLPNSLTTRLPTRVRTAFELAMGDRPGLWRYGTNLVCVLRRRRVQ